MKTQHIQTALLVIIGIALIANFFYKDDPEPQPIEIIIPEQKGSTGTQIIENVKTIPIPIPGGKEIYIDEKWYNEYVEAKDSIERLNKYLQAIQIKDTAITFINNDTIEIKGDLQTRGQLTKYKLDYTIKEKIFEYTPEVVVRYPKLSLNVHAEAGIPTTPLSGFVMKAGVGAKNQKGFGFDVSYDTEQRFWLGISKDIPVIK